MMIEVAYTQHCGKVARVQQDALWNGEACLQQNDLPVGRLEFAEVPLLLAVADGVSVSPSPHLASRLVLEALAESWHAELAIDGRTLRQIHGRLCDRYAKGKTLGSSTTLACLNVLGARCVAMNVGDSRVYRISAAGEWQQLSRDHTVLGRLVEEGAAEPGKAYGRIYDALESCLIADDGEDCFAIHRTETPFLPGDTLLLCTDGVHDVLANGALQRLYDPGAAPTTQVETWRQAILSAGAPDNFSLVLARCLQHPLNAVHGA